MAINDPTDIIQYPLGSKSFVSAARNASDFDVLINGDESATVVNRFGVTLESYTNLNDKIAAALVNIQSILDQFSIDSDAAIDDFEAKSGAAIDDFEAKSGAAIQSGNDAIDEVIARIAAFNRTGDWVANTNYEINDLWQDPSTLTWYWVLTAYTSDVSNIDADINGPNVAVFANTTDNYSYTFLNNVLGDKITYGVMFDDADPYDLILGRVADGTATTTEIQITEKVNNQLGVIVGGV